MATDIDKIFNQKFKLADYYLPPLTEGKYHATYKQVLQQNPKVEGEYSNTKDFCIAVNTEILPENEVFSIRPLPEQSGNFSAELPFIVLNNPAYPWMKSIFDSNNKPIPWPALIVISEKEIVEEKDVLYSQLKDSKKNTDKVYFPYEENKLLPCNPNDKVHVITIAKNTFEKIMPSQQDRYWLTHCKKIDLSDAEDKTTQNDGYFSVIIANRIPPYNAKQIITTEDKDKNKEENQNGNSDENNDNINNKITNTAHLIAAYLYDDCKTKDEYKNCQFVKLISLYHWKFNSDTDVVDKDFEPLVRDLDKGSDSYKSSVHKQTLKPHYLRTGEKTYSLYHSPIQPINYGRAQNLNGEKRYTSDGRLIYYKNHGIFDASYAAAFNLGRIVTLSHKTEAQQIVNWRKNQKNKDYIKALKENIKIDNDGLKIVIKKLKEGQLK